MKTFRTIHVLMFMSLCVLLGCSMGNKADKNTSTLKIDQFFQEIETINASHQHLNASKYLHKNVVWEGYVLSISSEPNVKSGAYLLTITVQPSMTNRFVDCWVHNYDQLKGLVIGQKVIVEGALHIVGYTSDKFNAPVLLDGGRNGMPSLSPCKVASVR